MAQVSVRKRGNKWQYTFEKAKVDGKRQFANKSGFATKKEALEEGTKALAEYNNAGLHFTPSEISVADYFDYWIEEYCLINVRYSTKQAYENIIKNHLKPRIRTLQIKICNSTYSSKSNQ